MPKPTCEYCGKELPPELVRVRSPEGQERPCFLSRGAVLITPGYGPDFCVPCLIELLKETLSKKEEPR